MSKDKQQHQYTQDELDNHANNCNRNHDQFWLSRGYDERPEDWPTRSPSADESDESDE